jgi:DNA polymerase III subunit delta'
MIIGHQKQWNFLKGKFQSGQLGHAYLFSGPEEVGKKSFAFDFLKLIDCRDGNGGDECQNCRLISQGKHPDVLVVKLKEDKAEIEISQIREVQQFLSLKPYYAPFKAVIIDGAEKMNHEAQSCFLKTLEEPKGKTILILTSSLPEMMLQTISSRCQVMKFFPVSAEQIKKHLIEKGAGAPRAQLLAGISDGKPGRAINLLENPEKIEKEKKILTEVSKACGLDLAAKFQYVKKVEQDQQKEVLLSFIRYFRQLLMLKMGIDKFAGLEYYPPVPEKLKSYPVLKIKQLIDLAETIDFRLLTTNASPKLALEVLLMET